MTIYATQLKMHTETIKPRIVTVELYDFTTTTTSVHIAQSQAEAIDKAIKKRFGRGWSFMDNNSNPHLCSRVHRSGSLHELWYDIYENKK